MTQLELWAGAECTVNRVGDRYSDQVRRTGHQDRLDDMDRLAALGARCVRFPVLWERVAPGSLDEADFAWTDSRLARLSSLGVKPIVGLVHHGSGPRHTQLDDESFVPGLAKFATKVAERYPWVDAFTPVNEPLTTARFSGLYGHWYPHARSTGAFLRMLVMQLLGVRAAMRAIRRISPQARLVQTEDFGRTYSTRTLAYQSRYENLRRWLSLDLLFGRVGPNHPLRDHLEDQGIPERILDSLVAEPCPPDIIGINYYLTSDRFIDERLERYPRSTWGGNGRHSYADIEAVRVLGEGIAGHRRVIEETWERYRTPLAITEAHVACTREEQIRWFAEAWRAAAAARTAGADVRAVTLWSAFGAVDWTSLVTCERGDYEPGAYDIRGPAPRPTALAKLARKLAAGGALDIPTLGDPGWWRSPRRLLYPPHGPTAPAPINQAPRALLVLGSDAFARSTVLLCETRGLRYVHRERLDPLTLASLGGSTGPWGVIVAMRPGFSTDLLPDAELRAVALACSERRVPLVLFSSETVFDGRATDPYSEAQPPSPLLPAGEVCLRREALVTEACPRALVVRTGVLFGALDAQDALTRALGRLARGQRVHSAEDVSVSPSYVPHVLTATIDLLVDGETGIFHLVPKSTSSPFALLRSAAEVAGISTDGLEAGHAERFHPVPWRPMRALTSERGWPLPELESAITAFVAGLTLGADVPANETWPPSSSLEMVFPNAERPEYPRARSGSL